jgi:hypothetical protein
MRTIIQSFCLLIGLQTYVFSQAPDTILVAIKDTLSSKMTVSLRLIYQEKKGESFLFPSTCNVGSQAAALFVDLIIDIEKREEKIFSYYNCRYAGAHIGNWYADSIKLKPLWSREYNR